MRRIIDILAPVSLVALIASCSAAGDAEQLSLGNDGTGGVTGGRSGSSTGGGLNLGGAQAPRVLTAHIESPPGVTVKIVTLSCSNDCADVLAVAEGGFPTYTYQWEDGSSDPARRVCPTATSTFVVSATDSGSNSGEFARDPQTVHADVSANVIQCPEGGLPTVPDSGAEAGSTGGGPADAGHGSLCATGDPVKGDPLGGTVTYFRQGAVVPAGRYRVSYMDGCMRFGQPVGWTIHNQLPVSWFLVGDTAANVLGTLPGVVGLGYTNFDDCVANSRQSPPLEIDFAGGKLGVVMMDYPLAGNMAGIDGRNAEWCLTPL